MTAFKPSTLPNSLPSFSESPSVTEAISAKKPVNPFAFSPAAEKSMPSSFAISAASDVGLITADNTPRKPVMALEVDKPPAVSAATFDSTSSIDKLNCGARPDT